MTHEFHLATSVSESCCEKGLLHDSSHPGHDVVVKAVDKVHQFDPQQTHSVNLLIYRLLDLYLLSQSSLQFLTDGDEIYEKETFHIIREHKLQLAKIWENGAL